MATATDYTHTYVGARYVPKFEDYSISNTYEPLSMVISNGYIYISKQYVPSGIDVSNTDYWAKMPAIDTDSEQVIIEAVNDWLDGHPEATTTVENNSITDSKLIQSGGILDSVNFLNNNVEFYNSFTESELEDGFYSTTDGTKRNNTGSSTYKRIPYLIPIDEKSMYVSNINCITVYYDKNKTFIGSGHFYTKTKKSKVEITPINAKYVGICAQDAESFSITKIISGFKNAEYPFNGNEYTYIENCWMNGNGNILTIETLNLIIVPNVKQGEKYFISNSAVYNCLCFDINNNLLTAEFEERLNSKIYTVPENAVIMYVNIYNNRTKGVNNELSDYLTKITKDKILCIGDSITWLDCRGGTYGGMSVFSGYQRQLRLNGYDVINAGYSGYPYANGLDVVDNVSYSIFNKIVNEEFDVSPYKYIILFGGTNDVLYNGEIGQRYNTYSNRQFDDTKFNGALSGIISYIRENNSECKILIASFPKSESTSRTFENAMLRVNEIIYNASFWSCKYINVFDEMNVQPTYNSFDEMFYDSTHPNFNGMQIIGKIFLNAINYYEN